MGDVGGKKDGAYWISAGMDEYLMYMGMSQSLPDNRCSFFPSTSAVKDFNIPDPLFLGEISCSYPRNLAVAYSPHPTENTSMVRSRETAVTKYVFGY